MATKREQERDIAYKRIIGQLNDQSVYENVMRSCSRMIDLQHIDNVLAACSQKPYATALNTYDRWMSEANRHIEKGKKSICIFGNEPNYPGSFFLYAYEDTKVLDGKLDLYEDLFSTEIIQAYYEKNKFSSEKIKTLYSDMISSILKSEEELKHKDEVFLAASIIVYERLEVDCNNEKSQLASVVRGFQPDDIYYVLDKAHSISRGLIQNIRMELDKLLETVKSRCLKLQTKPIRERDVLAYLTNVMGLTKEKAYFCLDFAQGNLGKAIKLAGNDEYAAIVDSVVGVLAHIDEMDVETLGKAVKDIEQFKMSMNDYMDLMMMWYRDAMMLKVTGNVDKILFKNEFSTLKKQAGKLTFKSIEDKIDAIAKAEQRLLANANFEVTIELLLLTLKEEASAEE